MKKIKVSHKGKQYDMHYYLTTFENEVAVCFTTPDHKPNPVIKSDFFFVKFNPHAPEYLSASGCGDDKDSQAFVGEATKVVLEQNVGIQLQAN